ncbi:MAG: hypothetical protein ABSB56_09650 [Nitrososphaerales archaeon]
MGNRTRVLGAASIALGCLMLETADKVWGQTLGTWLNIAGLALLILGNPVLAQSRPAKYYDWRVGRRQDALLLTRIQ